jgi:hypothetical protein
VARLFELSTHVQSVSRGDGRSATAAAAYRACCVIDCEREGKRHDYTRKGGLEVSEIVLPDNAAAWAKDRSKLWNAAEQAEANKSTRAKTPNRKNAQTAREFFFSFPIELSQEGRLEAARIIARHLVNTHGIAADFAIHEPGREGDERNFHCHMLTTTRRLDSKGLGEKAREWADLKDGAKLAKAMRAFIAKTLNDRLAAEGKAELVHVEHRSFKSRGSSQKPQQHQGPGKTHEQRKKRGQARRAWFQRMQMDQTERHGKELASLKLRQDFGLQNQQAELARRGREGAKAIKRDLDAARAADKPVDGMRRTFLAISGRLGRAAFDRQARDMQRMTEAKQKLADLKTELRQERSAYSTAQTKERAAVIERHGDENKQLQEALRHRESLDRSTEVSQRQEQARPVQERDRCDHF